ncbi:MAG: ACT domain-containing protein [Campylobacterota bacterium]
MQTIKQLSIFIENKMGELTQVTKLLSQNGLSIKSINLAEASDFGLLRVIVDEPQKAKEVLDSAGFSLKISEVFAVSIDDHIGSFNEVVHLLFENGINIEYTYTVNTAQNGAFVFKVAPSKLRQAMELLESHRVTLIESF